MNNIRRTITSFLLLWLSGITPKEDINTHAAIGQLALAMMLDDSHAG